ncbi:hypothetical protein ACKVWM_003481 [Pyricularia oryzae]
MIQQLPLWELGLDALLTTSTSEAKINKPSGFHRQAPRPSMHCVASPWQVHDQQHLRVMHKG